MTVTPKPRRGPPLEPCDACGANRTEPGRIEYQPLCPPCIVILTRVGLGRIVDRDGVGVRAVVVPLVGMAVQNAHARTGCANES